MDINLTLHDAGDIPREDMKDCPPCPVAHMMPKCMFLHATEDRCRCKQGLCEIGEANHNE